MAPAWVRQDEGAVAPQISSEDVSFLSNEDESQQHLGEDQMDTNEQAMPSKMDVSSQHLQLGQCVSTPCRRPGCCCPWRAGRTLVFVLTSSLRPSEEGLYTLPRLCSFSR